MNAIKARIVGKGLFVYVCIKHFCIKVVIDQKFFVYSVYWLFNS